MTKITREPGVYRRNQVIGYTEPESIDNNVKLSTYVQIVSDTGPSGEAVLISNLAHLLSTFTIDKTLTLNSPKCLLEAAYLSSNSPLWVKRIAPSVVYGELGKSAVLTLKSGDEVLCNIYHKYANAKDLLKVDVIPLEDGRYIINFHNVQHDPEDLEGRNDFITFTDSYTVTLELDSVDEMQLPNNILTIMEHRNDIEIELAKSGEVDTLVVNGGTPVEVIEGIGGSVYFGGYPTEEGSEDNIVNIWMRGEDANIKTAWLEALQELLVEDSYSPNFVFSTTIPSTDTGKDQKDVENALASLSPNLDMMVIYNPYLTDYEYKTVSKLEYPATAEGRLDLPGFYDTSLLGQSILFGGGLLYHQTVCIKDAAGKTYVPIMGRGEGLILTDKLASKYNREERLALLNKGFSVIRSRTIRTASSTTTYNYYVLNNSLRSAIVDDVISEEQNMRIVNQMGLDLDERLEIIVGKLGVEETVAKAKELVDNYFNNEVFLLSPCPVTDVSVQCDMENNTASTLRQRRILVTVAVRLGSAVRYVDVLNKVLPTK